MHKFGIIGGSGLDDPKLLENYQELEVETSFGKPSSKLTTGQIGQHEVVIIARHGKGHTIMPTKVPYRANIMALKDQGCTH
ncbi:S-methyl-5'-thioadenosine phosphorylase, partial [Candidatus Falkowbacteria bacterium]|nr:S-methyl-5'-thioadenosine phosphorylase [Candidatus Falkowbacteria bacterium]